MSVYVDHAIGCLVANNWQWTRVAHLMADTETELIRFGKRIGCKPKWLMHSRTGVPHFDVTIRMRDKALKAGAIPADRKKVVEIMKAFTAQGEGK